MICAKGKVPHSTLVEKIERYRLKTLEFFSTKNFDYPRERNF